MQGKKQVIFVSIMVLLFLCLVLPVFAGGDQEEKGKKFTDVKEWEKYAGLGDYLPAEDDWEEIERLAKEEGSVVIYCNSGSIFDSARTFYEKYGIKAEPYDVATANLYEKLGREMKAGIRNADVILSSGTHIMDNEFVKRGEMYRYIPKHIEPLLMDMAKN